MKENIEDIVAVNVAIRTMVDILNSPKKIDELKRLPAYVKDGTIYDFEDRKFWNTKSEDGEIFSVEKVLKAQAVTSALKRDYTNALMKWISDDEGGGETTEPVKPKKAKKVKDEVDEALEADIEINFMSDVKELLEAGKLKKANKLIKDNAGHSKAKKAKKLYKKAVKAKEVE